MGIQEGLEIGGSPVAISGDLSDDAFNELVKAGASQNATETVEEPSRCADPGEDSAERIIWDVLGPDTLPTVQAGLTIHDPSVPKAGVPERPRELSPESRRLVESAVEEQRQDNADREELAGHRFLMRCEDATGDHDVLVALAELRRVAPEGYEAALWDLAQDVSGIDPELDEGDVDAMQTLAGTLEELETSVERVEAEARLEEAERLIAGLTEENNRKTIESQRRAVREWQDDQGLSSAQARARIEAAESFSRNVLGIELSRLTDSKEFKAALAVADATLRESETMERTRAINQQLLDTPSTSIGDGLTHFSALGRWERLNGVNLADELGPPVPSPQRIVARASARRVTGAEIRGAVTETTSTSVREGLRGPSGRPISIDEASGARRRFEQEQIEARARTMGWRR
jgi:hypothetical protein